MQGKLELSIKEGLSADKSIRPPLQDPSDQMRRAPKQPVTEDGFPVEDLRRAPKVVPSRGDMPIEEMRRAPKVPVAKEEKQDVVQQNDSQSLSSILGAVTQILQYVSNPDSAGTSAKNQNTTAGVPSANGSNSNINVTTPINISVGNETGAAPAESAANQIAQLISQAISQIEPKIKQIATEAATLAANKTAGNKVPPTQGMFS